jgi:hypothetical protein
MRNITQMTNNKLEIITHIFRDFVASLMLTTGVYVGVSVLSEFRSDPITPSTFAGAFATSFAVSPVVASFLSLLRAPRERNVGRTIAG